MPEPDPLPTVAVPGGWGAFLDQPALGVLKRDVFPGWLARQRWFGGKARMVAEVRVADAGPLATPASLTLLTLLDVAFADGGRDRYFVPLAVRFGDAAGPLAQLTRAGREASLVDAGTDEDVCTELLSVIADGWELRTRHGRVRGVPTAAFGRLRGDSAAPLSVRRGPTASSNTLVFFGDRLLLKLFRRLEPGVNPDFEVGRFLTESGRFAHTPPVAGALVYERADGPTYMLGILQAAVPNQGDGWGHALDELAAYYARAAGQSPPAADSRPPTELLDADPPPAVRHAIGPYLDAAATLGRRTAELHRALASDAADPAFAPEPLTAADLTALADETAAQARTAFAALAAHVDRLPADVAADARRLLAAGPGAFAPPAGGEPPHAVKTRIHGDYHLGQVLRVDGDYVVLDFEGEPARTVAERRGKFSPVRDVAGMLRSYHYAAYAGLFAFAADRPGDLARLEPWADLWHRWASAAFLRAYLGAVDGVAVVPAARGAFADLLARFTLAKALYELAYELNNRPDWVRIPLRGVLALAGDAARPGRTEAGP